MLPGSHDQGSPAEWVGVLNPWHCRCHTPGDSASAFCPESAKLNIIQCRMARTALDWSLQDLADASGVSRRTIARFESGESVLPLRIQALRHTFEAKGVLFLDNAHLAGGVVPPKR